MLLNKNIMRSPLLLFFLGIALIGFFYHSTLSVFHLRWSEQSSAFSHGYLLAPLSFWLVAQEWRERNPLFEFSWTPIILIAGVSFIWFAGRVVTVEFVEQSAVILICALLVPAVIGYKSSFRILLPILFLFTTVPIIETLVGSPLQALTAVVSGVLLNISGVRTFQDGYLLMIPAGSFVVEQSCSGIRYQIAAISLALIDAYISRMAWRYFLSYIILAILTAFIANSIRILIIVYVAQMTNMQTSLVDDHVWVGWVVFSILMPVMMWAWHKHVLFSVIAPASKALPDKDFPMFLWIPKNAFLLLSLVLALSLGPVLEFLLQNNVSSNSQYNVAPDFVIKDNQWQPIQIDRNYWSPAVMKPDVSLLKRFRLNDSLERKTIDVFAGYYAQQKNDREAINVVNKVFNGNLWSVVSKKNNVDVDFNNLKVEEILLRRNGSTDRLVWRWFNVGGKMIGNPVMAKGYNFISTLTGRPDITVYIIAADVREDKNETSSNMRKFIADNINRLSVWVEEIRHNEIHNK